MYYIYTHPPTHTHTHTHTKGCTHIQVQIRRRIHTHSPSHTFRGGGRGINGCARLVSDDGKGISVFVVWVLWNGNKKEVEIKMPYVNSFREYNLFFCFFVPFSTLSMIRMRNS